MITRWSSLAVIPALLLNVTLAHSAPQTAHKKALAKTQHSPQTQHIIKVGQTVKAKQSAKPKQSIKGQWPAKTGQLTAAQHLAKLRQAQAHAANHAANVRVAQAHVAKIHEIKVQMWKARVAHLQAVKSQHAAKLQLAKAQAEQAHAARMLNAARAQKAAQLQAAAKAQAQAHTIPVKVSAPAHQVTAPVQPVHKVAVSPKVAPAAQAGASAMPTPLPAPPAAQVYATFAPGLRFSGDQPMVPISFLSNQLGASAGKLQDATGGFYRIEFFGQRADLYPYQVAARFNNAPVTLIVAPQLINNELYLPWTPLAQLFGVKWSATSGNTGQDAQTTLLLQYQAAYIRSVRHSSTNDRLRVVVTLSGPTRITASQEGTNAVFRLAGARTPGTPALYPLQDVLGKRIGIDSGNWNASVKVPLNYRAPISWFTLGSPPRLVIDAQRIFNEEQSSPVSEQMRLTSIRKGTSDGPVQMWVAYCDPRDGWRVQIAPAGYGAFVRAPTSHIASRHKATIAVNGGYFATDGAAVGAVLVDGEWIRLPWKARSAVGFRPDGTAHIGNLQAQARVTFSNGLVVPVRNLNGWPDLGTVSVMTSRFGRYYKLRPGEIAVEVKNGVVVAKPGSGGTDIDPTGFTLVANGDGAKQWFNSIARGQTAKLQVDAIGWEGITTALGGGPRLVSNGRIEVTSIREAIPADIRVGRGPRTAIGIDKQGRYIIVVVDGRRPGYSIGMTLYELAATMQKLGAVDALNLDGGGSTALAVRSRLVNHPSDGTERRVANALLITR